MKDSTHVSFITDTFFRSVWVTKLPLILFCSMRRISRSITQVWRVNRNLKSVILCLMGLCIVPSRRRIWYVSITRFFRVFFFGSDGIYHGFRSLILHFLSVVKATEVCLYFFLARTDLSESLSQSLCALVITRWSVCAYLPISSYGTFCIFFFHRPNCQADRRRGGQ